MKLFSKEKTIYYKSSHFGPVGTGDKITGQGDEGRIRDSRKNFTVFTCSK